MNQHSQINKLWEPGYVYVIDYGDAYTFKIGYTKYPPERRLKQIMKSDVIMPMELVFSAYVSTNAFFVENIIHMTYDFAHKNGEWFQLDGYELVNLFKLINGLSYGNTKYYDRWFEIMGDEFADEYEARNWNKDPYLRKDEYDKHLLEKSRFEGIDNE